MGRQSPTPPAWSRSLVLLVIGCSLAAALGPALAADREVDIGGFAFAPETVNVDPSEKVTWRWAGAALALIAAGLALGRATRRSQG